MLHLRGKWPSISNFSSVYQPARVESAMMSGINQELTPRIQEDPGTFAFLPAQIWSLSCCGSLAADYDSFFVLRASI